ncbi:hypothetical protein VoSk93_24570 [Vibrio owensii]
MAYLPFYITPEELAVYQESQEQEILAGDNVLTWHKYDVGEPFRYYFKLFALPFVIAPFLLTFLIHTKDTVDVTIFSFILSVIVSGAFYLTIGLDYRYDYAFSNKGFLVKKRRNMPIWVNTAVQAVGWFGALVCVLMVAVAGPIALAGAGAFILVSFKRLKRQPDEVAEVKVGKREDWLFAYYNKKRKVIRFYHKYDECSKWNLEKHTVFRAQTRGYSYIFFKTAQDLDAMLETLSNKYGVECIDFPDHKAFFEGRPEPRIEDIPSRSLEFPVTDTFDLRARNAPLPEWRRIYNGTWQTESEIEQSKSELATAKE